MCVRVQVCTTVHVCVVCAHVHVCTYVYMCVCTHVHTIDACVPDFSDCMQFITQLPLSCCYAKQSVFNGGNVIIVTIEY